MHCMTNARRRMLFGNECPRKKAPRFAPSRRACSSRSPRPSWFLVWHKHGLREHDCPFFFPPNAVAEGGGGAPPRSRGDYDGWWPPVLSAHAEPRARHRRLVRRRPRRRQSQGAAPAEVDELPQSRPHRIPSHQLHLRPCNNDVNMRTHPIPPPNQGLRGRGTRPVPATEPTQVSQGDTPP